MAILTAPARSAGLPRVRRPVLPGVLAEVRHLLWFRRVTARGRAGSLLPALLAAVLVALAVATAPAVVDVDPATRARAAVLLAPALLAFVVGGALAAAAGGGRELLARDPAAVHPIDPVADHLGSLLLAPLNAGWLVQSLALLGLTSFVVGPAPGSLLGAQALVAGWILAATAAAQGAAGAVELLRRLEARRRPGLAVLGSVLVAGLLALLLARAVVGVVAFGGPGAHVLVLLALLVVAAAATAAGARTATLVARHAPRAEGRVETRTHRPRALPDRTGVLLRRLDRASVWRSLPLRRGLVLLAAAPAAAVLVGGPDWSTLLLMPGLVASGGLLLFGVNLWCLDGRGLLWRETLPAPPAALMHARLAVLAEILLGTGAAVLLLGALRAGVPSSAELLAAVLAVLVAGAQGLSAAARWSLAHPHAVDLRSPRATPAPPVAMLGYSLRLSLTATLTGLLLATLGGAGRSDLLVVTGVALLAVPALRVRRAVVRWSDPQVRSPVVAAVTA